MTMTTMEKSVTAVTVFMKNETGGNDDDDDGDA